MNTITKVYAAIAGIPLAAILLVSGVSGGSNSTYDYDDYERELATRRSAAEASGTGVSEAEAYSSLGKYNPCIFIACEGE